MSDGLLEIAAVVETRLERLFRQGRAEPATGLFRIPEQSELLSQVRDLTLRSGKRLRAGLVVCGAMLFQPDAIRETSVVDAAAAMELLHTYFLIHDDIMDGDDTRRGGPSVHAALAKAHNDPGRGRNLAILAGDLAVSLHEGLVAGLQVEESRRSMAARIFSEVHLDVVHGQNFDLLAEMDPEEVALHKTASYTTIGPLTIGGVLAGANANQMAHLCEIAKPLGVAFQFRDDLLGLFGETDQTGKPVGTDLKENKRTFLIKEAMGLAKEPHRSAIEAVLGNRDATEGQIGNALDALVESGARRSCDERIDSMVDGALSRLDATGYLPEGKQLLTDLARMMANRNR